MALLFLEKGREIIWETVVWPVEEMETRRGNGDKERVAIRLHGKEGRFSTHYRGRAVD